MRKIGSIHELRKMEREEKGKLTGLDLSGADTSGVENMQYLFMGCSAVKALDLSGFDTSGVTSMESMFLCCEALEKVDVSSFDTSHVTRMQGMFSWCKSLTELDLSNFDFSNVEFINGMFSNCPNLKKVIVSDTILKVEVKRPEEEPAGWTDAHTPSQQWAYARVIERKERFGSMTEWAKKDHLGLRYSGQELIIVPHRQTTRSEKPTPKPAPVPAPTVTPELSFEPKSVEPAEKPISPYPISPSVQAEMERRRRNEQKKVNFWAWMFAIAVFIIAFLVVLWTSD